MKSLTFDDIFSPPKPLAYTFSDMETKTLNLKTAVTNLDIIDSNSFFDLIFGYALSLTTSSAADLIFNFTLNKVPYGDTIPIEVTSFKLSKSFTEVNLSVLESGNFRYPLRNEVIDAPTEYYLELTSIINNTAASFELNLKGTILGVISH